jgi:hypothetical protein
MNKSSLDRTIRAYCLSKGYDAQGLCGLDAIREQLAHENNGIYHPRITQSTQIDISLIALKDIIEYNKHHYDAVEPRPLISPLNGPIIAGVVFARGRHYSLLDGYHRLKWAHSHGVEHARYIILS